MFDKENFEELKKLVEAKDSEAVHSIYDGLMESIATKHDPRQVKRLKEVVKDIDFWYA